VGFAPGERDPIIRAMHLDLSDDEAAALTQELHEIVERERPLPVLAAHPNDGMRVPSSGQPTRTFLPGHPVILTRPPREQPARPRPHTRPYSPENNGNVPEQWRGWSMGVVVLPRRMLHDGIEIAGNLRL
jgi:hypothetical protein